MDKEQAKLYAFATGSIAIHLHKLYENIKMIDINIEITDKKYANIIKRMREIKLAADLVIDNVRILNEINRKQVQTEQSPAAPNKTDELPEV